MGTVGVGAAGTVLIVAALDPAAGIGGDPAVVGVLPVSTAGAESAAATGSATGINTGVNSGCNDTVLP